MLKDDMGHVENHLEDPIGLDLARNIDSPKGNHGVVLDLVILGSHCQRYLI